MHILGSIFSDTFQGKYNSRLQSTFPEFGLVKFVSQHEALSTLKKYWTLLSPKMRAGADDALLRLYWGRFGEITPALWGTTHSHHWLSQYYRQLLRSSTKVHQPLKKKKPYHHVNTRHSLSRRLVISLTKVMAVIRHTNKCLVSWLC